MGLSTAYRPDGSGQTTPLQRPALTAKWAVFGRGIGWGMVWGAVFGGLAGLPFMLIGAVPGAVVGAGAGLACSLVPSLVVAADAPRLRRHPVLARWMAALLSAVPAAVWATMAHTSGTTKSGFVVCAAAAGVTAAFTMRRILFGPPVRQHDLPPGRNL